MHPVINAETLTLSLAASFRISASIATGIETERDCVLTPGGRPLVAGGLVVASLLMSPVFLCQNNAEAIYFFLSIKIVGKNQNIPDRVDGFGGHANARAIDSSGAPSA
jgi:hypothetical protein